MGVDRNESRDSISARDDAARAWSRLGEGDFHRRLAATTGIAVVLFSAPRCSACSAWRQLLPQALIDEADGFFEVDVADATGLARYFDIFHLPTIYLYRDGRFHAELQCEARMQRVRDRVRGLLADPPQDEP